MLSKPLKYPIFLIQVNFEISVVGKSNKPILLTLKSASDKQNVNHILPSKIVGTTIKLRLLSAAEKNHLFLIFIPCMNYQPVSEQQNSNFVM